jgi:hypothetical protein
MDRCVSESWIAICSSNPEMKTEPNKAMEPTPVSVTDRAPSSTLRATYLRGSS